MLQGLDVEPNPMDVPVHEDLKVVFCDDLIAVVDKPSGMLSVPGRRTDAKTGTRLFGYRCQIQVKGRAKTSSGFEFKALLLMELWL